MRKKRVKIKSITQRWMVNTLSVVLAALLFLAVIFAFGMRNFYYSAARQALDARANLALGVLLRISSSNTVNFNTELRNLVENSDEKDKLEVTAIDHSGRIALSSSGFSYQRQEEMPDYEEALHSATGKGDYIGRSSEGEKIMAMSVMIPSITAEYSAVRYVVSLENVDRQLVMYMLVFGLIALLILGFVMLSGLFFVKSIVIPVREVGAAARKFATGDMSERIEKKSDDELGELCDIINFMADEISNSEELKMNLFLRSPTSCVPR